MTLSVLHKWNILPNLNIFYDFMVPSVIFKAINSRDSRIIYDIMQYSMISQHLVCGVENGHVICIVFSSLIYCFGRFMVVSSLNNFHDILQLDKW